MASTMGGDTKASRTTYIIFGIPTRDRSDDAELLFLLGPAMRQRAGERGDREISGGGTVLAPRVRQPLLQHRGLRSGVRQLARRSERAGR